MSQSGAAPKGAAGDGQREFYGARADSDELCRRLIAEIIPEVRAESRPSGWLKIVLTLLGWSVVSGAAYWGVSVLFDPDPIGALVYFLVFTLSMIGWLVLGYPSSVQRFLPWLIGGNRELREIAEHQMRHYAPYEVFVDGERLGFSLGGEPVKKRDFFELRLNSDMDDPLKLPVGPAVGFFLEVPEKRVHSVDLVTENDPPVKISEIRSAVPRGDRLEIWTEDDRLLEIPDYFPTKAILGHIAEHNPKAVRRGRALSW